MDMKKMNRRSFIKKSTMAAAATAPFFIAKDLLANGSPNEKIKMAVIGLGKQAGAHLGPIASNPQTNLSAICDVDDERLDYVFNNYKCQRFGTKKYKDFREINADKSIDAVVIVTPDHWHTIQTVLAARAGKHVYCEKPLTYSIQEGHQMLTAVKKAGIVFQTGSMQRSDLGFSKQHQLVASGALGEIKEVWCNFGRKFPTFYNWPAEPLPKGMDWEMWVGPAPMREYSSHLLAHMYGNNGRKEAPYSHPWGEWRWHVDYGNGMQADWGAHHFDIAQWGLGMDGKGPKYVHVYESKGPTPGDTKNIYYEYENGAKVYYGVPGVVRTKGCTVNNPMVTFIGTEGIACASRGPHFWTDVKKWQSGKIPPATTATEVTNGHMQNFIDGIMTGRPVICPVEVGVSSCNMCIIGNIAHRLGRPLEWDWKTCTFKGDAEANKYLWRENRGEWAKVI